MLRRVFDRFLGLSLVQKALAALFAALFLFSLSYLLTTVVLYLGGAGGDQVDSPVEQGPASPTAGSRSSASASTETTVLNNELGISGARWEDQRAVVEGTRKGDISSVHCDLLEGGASGVPMRWWDRTVGTRMDWSERTFAQEFGAAGEGGGGEPLDPAEAYGVFCSAQLSVGWSVNDAASVEGTPPVEAPASRRRNP